MRMLRVTMLLVCTAIIWGASAQGYNKRYDAFGQGFAQGAFGLEQNAAGNTLFSGSFEPDTVSLDSLLATYALILQRTDQDGNVQWQRRYHRPIHREFLGWADCCDTVTGGGFVIGGSSQNISNVIEARLLRFDAQGDSLWSRSFGGIDEYWIGQQVKYLSDGGFVICGGTDATGDQDGFVIRTDSVGNELWRQTYGWPVPMNIDGLTAIAEATNGDLFMSGYRFLSATNDQHWVQRTTAGGSVIWSVNWGGPFKEGATYLTLLNDGFPLVLGGTAYGADYLSMKPYMAKLDTTDGSILWEREYGPLIYSTLFFAGKECPNTDLIACGVTYAYSYEQGILLRAASNGDSLWMRTYSYHDSLIDQGEGRFWDVLPTEDGGFIAAGFANAPFNGPYPPGYSQDRWVVKVDSMGCIVPGCDGVGIVEQVTNLEGALKVYPNPVAANGQLTVELSLPSSMHLSAPLRLVLTSMQGQLVKELTLPTQHDQRVVLDLGGLAAGLYSVHVADGGRWLTGARLVIE